MKNRPITFEPDLTAIIRKCSVCNVSMVDDEGLPYVVPMNFGYEKDVVYLHSAPSGKKIDILKQHPDVCISFSTDHQLRWQSSEIACSYSMKYRSVILYGQLEFVDDFSEKLVALESIMRQYTDQVTRFSDPAVNQVCVMKVNVRKIEGRAYGY